jgi:Cytochrome c3/Class III cytochrome C family
MRMRHAIALSVAASLAVSVAASAQSLERLVMPGPVAAAHADIEAECGKCHQPFERGAEKGLCLVCHDRVAADLRAQRGFHGRSPAAAGSDCRSCHTEHRGRDADILGLDRESFDHVSADFALRGAHTRVACAQCHTAGERFSEAPSDCAACHGKADPHAGSLGADCAGCHVEASWKEARFDHAETSFPLDGKHEAVECALCHPGQRYAGTPQTCSGCHALNDEHEGRYGPECETCHSTSGWKEARFDHGRDTRFALTGAHATADCEGCHAGGRMQPKPASDCLACHRSDDVHENRNGTACASCHGTSAWKPARFDHDADTKFPLQGAHDALACESCHTGSLHERKLDTTCISCHRDDDAHEGQQGADCARCHGVAGWKEKVAFDHDLTRFPLLGAHAVTACEECHASAAYQGTELRCAGCHAAKDEHEGRLGSSCESCHNPNSWAAWRFDHASRTSFALLGAHEEIGCESCHHQPVGPGEKLAIPKDCATCHALDDPHRDAFGSDCGRCHGASSWKEVRIPR